MNSAAWRMSLNEKEFVLAALAVEQRVDGRRPFDARRLTITFAKQDGAVEVQQGQTRVMAVVTGQLGPPYPDRPTEGSLAIFTEFSPMADPTFEAGRPGEMAIELGRIIDRGLRESRAVDTESLCVLAGRAVWALRVDIHILDNGGNLVDVANIAALAALLSYRRPDCSIGGHNGQEVIVHPPEVREPVSLIIHHLPIAVTFAFFGNGDLQVVDPSLKEEAVMGGRLTVTVNAQGDICAIQKGGGVGVTAAEIMRCVRIASSKSSEVTNQLKKAVEANNLERSNRKIKRHPKSTLQDVAEGGPDEVRGDVDMGEVFGSSVVRDERTEAIMEIIKEAEMEESTSSESEEDEEDSSDGVEEKKQKVEGEPGIRSVVGRKGMMDRKAQTSRRVGLFEGGPSLWDNDPDVKGSSKTSQKLLDTDALAEFNNVADMITKSVTQSSVVTADGSLKSESLAVTQSSRVTADGSLESKSLATMSAAVVYAQIPEQSTQFLRPLGPIFPIVGGDSSVEQKPSLSSLGVLSGVELKPAPTSLLDAVKRKRKKGKNQ